VSPKSYLKTEQRAASNWQLAISQNKTKGKALRPSACLGLGLGLGDPWVTQASPKGHARATPSVILALIVDKCFVCNRNGKKAGVGWKNKLPLNNTDDTDQKEPNPKRTPPRAAVPHEPSPGLNRVSPYFSGLTRGGEGYPARIPPCKNQRSPIPSRLLRAKSLF
jgi:hypothetical protein